MEPVMAPTYELLDVPLFSGTKDALMRAIATRVHRGDVTTIVTPNSEILLRASKDPVYQRLLKEATVAIPDGAGLLLAVEVIERHRRALAKRTSHRHHRWACWSSLVWYEIAGFFHLSAKTGRPIPERIAGSDLTWDLLDLANRDGLNVALIGGIDPAVGAQAAERVRERFPRVSITALQGGRGEQEDDMATIDALKAASAQVLFVCFGAPKQEAWMKRIIPQLPKARIAIGAGGTIDFLAQTKHRAPRWMRTLGMEWLYRLIREPRRLGRIWNATVVFQWLIVRRVAAACRQS